MKAYRTLTRKLFFLALLPALLATTGNALAGDQVLNCKLYIAESMDSEASSNLTVEAAGVSLVTLRRAAICIFPDGSVADKQFVMVNRVVGDGSTGSSSGYSVYTMDNGDTLSAEFTGGWGSNGFQGTYNILGGTGSFEGASGDGSIADTQSPWKTTGVVDIVLNVKTP